MILLNSEEFDKLVADAIDTIPEKYFTKLQNVFFTSEDEPTPAQRKKLQLRSGHTLFGLYEGIPLTKRSAGYNLVLPDKITIFRLPILAVSTTKEEVATQIQKTVWHEVAHYFGLDHDQIHELEQ